MPHTPYRFYSFDRNDGNPVVENNGFHFGISELTLLTISVASSTPTLIKFANSISEKSKGSTPMGETNDDSESMPYTVCEVVGVFPTASALETAVEQLGLAGVNRVAISVLGVDKPPSDRIEALYRSAKAIEDDPAARRAAFVSPESRTEGEAVAISFPLLIGGFGSAWAVAAAGGALVTAIGATILGGAVGAGLGALLVLAVARHHSAYIHSQLTRGGLVLWVRTPDKASERRALDVLRRCSGMSVHTHTIERKWGMADSPLHHVQPDPFLERDSAITRPHDVGKPAI